MPLADLVLSKRQTENLQIFEKECMNEHLRTVEKKKHDEINARVQVVQRK